MSSVLTGGELTAMPRPFMPGWWVVRGEPKPPYDVVATFDELRDAVDYVRRNGPKRRGRPGSGLNDQTVSYALRVSARSHNGKPNMSEAAALLGVHRNTLRAFINQQMHKK
jgi:hypothetical protein